MVSNSYIEVRTHGKPIKRLLSIVEISEAQDVLDADTLFDWKFYNEISSNEERVVSFHDVGRSYVIELVSEKEFRKRFFPKGTETYEKLNKIL